jgi:hypothetical protein
MAEERNGMGDGGNAVAVFVPDLVLVSGVSPSLSCGRRDTYTFRKVILDAPHLGTIADSKLSKGQPSDKWELAHEDSHDCKPSFRRHVV